MIGLSNCNPSNVENYFPSVVTLPIYESGYIFERPEMFDLKCYMFERPTDVDFHVEACL